MALEVLDGGAKSLDYSEFCLLEVLLLVLDSTSLILEVMNCMDDNGFQSYDICKFIRRPFDKALYQGDLLFIKMDSRFIKDRRW